MNSWQYRYDTGWINRTDWTNVHLGSNTTLNTDSNVTHNLNAPLSNLLVKVFVSTDGTDANSFEVGTAVFNDATSRSVNFTTYQIDLNNIKIQTGLSGLYYQIDDGTIILLDNENYYYKAKVYFLG